MPKIEITEEQSREMINKEILKQYPDAKDFRISPIGESLIDGYTYYVAFTTAEENSEDSFFYAFLDKNGCKLLDDGEDVIKHFEVLLDRKKNVLQRLSEFDLLDIVGAFLALMIVGAFTWLITTGAKISAEFLAIVSLVLGYYFGRSKTKA
jgi:hypothetical protein